MVDIEKSYNIEDILQIHFNFKENILNKIYIVFDLEIHSQLLPAWLVKAYLYVF